MRRVNKSKISPYKKKKKPQNENEREKKQNTGDPVPVDVIDDRSAFWRLDYGAPNGGRWKIRNEKKKTNKHKRKKNKEMMERATSLG